MNKEGGEGGFGAPTTQRWKIPDSIMTLPPPPRGGAWVSQQVKLLILDFTSGHDLWVVRYASGGALAGVDPA